MFPRRLHFARALGWSLACLLLPPWSLAEEPAVTENAPVEYALVLHGGAGNLPGNLTEAERPAYAAGLKQALVKGERMLAEGADALDVVEAVIRILEDDPLFNAGRGAVFNTAGGHELDASIMDGRQRACGAVAGVRTVKNPISLARRVMTQTRHVLLAGDGAEQFAAAQEQPLVENNYFDTPQQRERWRRAMQQPDKEAGDGGKQDKHGTVGCVAWDRRGHLAAGTSTGGTTNKLNGRIGDSPIVGAGTYADDRTCGVSCTGIGEHFIRNAVAYDVSAQIAYKNVTVAAAVEQILKEKLKPGDGGIIAIDHRGRIVANYNTPGMFYALADSSGRFEVHAGK